MEFYGSYCYEHCAPKLFQASPGRTVRNYLFKTNLSSSSFRRPTKDSWLMSPQPALCDNIFRRFRTWKRRGGIILNPTSFHVSLGYCGSAAGCMNTSKCGRERGIFFKDAQALPSSLVGIDCSSFVFSFCPDFCHAAFLYNEILIVHTLFWPCDFLLKIRHNW